MTFVPLETWYWRLKGGELLSGRMGDESGGGGSGCSHSSTKRLKNSGKRSEGGATVSVERGEAEAMARDTDLDLIVMYTVTKDPDGTRASAVSTEPNTTIAITLRSHNSYLPKNHPQHPITTTNTNTRNRRT